MESRDVRFGRICPLSTADQLQIGDRLSQRVGVHAGGSRRRRCGSPLGLRPASGPRQRLTKFAQFGIYQLYEFKRWRREPFVITEGAGNVQVTHFGDEEIKLHAAAGSHGTLRLNVSYFPRWHAYRDGVAERMGLRDKAA